MMSLTGCNASAGVAEEGEAGGGEEEGEDLDEDGKEEAGDEDFAGSTESADATGARERTGTITGSSIDDLQRGQSSDRSSQGIRHREWNLSKTNGFKTAD